VSAVGVAETQVGEAGGHCVVKKRGKDRKKGCTNWDQRVGVRGIGR